MLTRGSDVIVVLYAQHFCPLLRLAKVWVPRISCLDGAVDENPSHDIQYLTAHRSYAL